MTIRGCLAIAIASGGCNALLGLDPTHAAVDGASGADTRAVDAAPDAPVCAAQTARGGALQDTIIINGDPQNHGTLGTANASAGLGSIALVTFHVPDLPPGAAVTGLTLNLPWAPSAHDCSGVPTACGSCATIDTGGTFRVVYLRSDWAEATVNWTQRSPGVPWGQPGAAQLDVDRSGDLVAATHVTDSDTTVALGDAAVALLPTWGNNGTVSFAILPGPGTAMVLVAHEYPALDGTCAPPPSGAASFDVVYCAP